MKTVTLLLLLFLANPTFSQEINVLFIGNSYTHYNNMPKIFENLSKSKGHQVYADSIAVSGSNLKEHAQRRSTYTKLKSRKWHYIVIQGFSREFAEDSSTIARESIPYVEQILDSAKKYNSCASFYFYLTWGYKEGFPEDIRYNTNKKMHDRVLKGYMQLQERFGYPIVPVGLVWDAINRNNPEINFYQIDHQHPNITGSYAIAACFFTSFFLESAVKGTVPRRVNLQDIDPIIRTVDSVVFNNLVTLKIDTVQQPLLENVKLNFTISEEWRNITIRNTSTGNVSYTWHFGDGNHSKRKNPRHYYRHSGTYTVTLVARDACFTYRLRKQIKVSNREKFATSRPKADRKKT